MDARARTPLSPLCWPALDAARADARAARLPFIVGDVEVGSVALDMLDALRTLTRGDRRWRVDGAGVAVTASDAEAALAGLNSQLHAQRLIAGWRNELVDVPGTGPLPGVPLRIERATARFWGTTTVAAHLTGWVADRLGRPAELWIARRAENKATDPGRLDTLVGGGVASGQTPEEALVREAWEEAGLAPGQLCGTVAGRVLLIDRAVAEGWQRERIHAFDLVLPDELVPTNRDGEVQAFMRLPVAEAAALARSGDMTLEASLVTLDHLLRHRLLAGEPSRHWAAALDRLAA